MLLPISLVLVVLVGGLVLWPVTAGGFFWDRYVGWPLTLLLVGFLLVVMIRALQWNKRRAGELAYPGSASAAGQPKASAQRSAVSGVGWRRAPTSSFTRRRDMPRRHAASPCDSASGRRY